MTVQNYLTKSKYVNGLQCHKRLWYEINYPERASTISRSQQRAFNQGKEVGVRARDLFPEGVIISATSPTESVEQTEVAIRSGVSCIFEASFVYNNTWVRCDILQKDADSWKLIEVKTSARDEKKYLPDLAVQKYVLDGCGIPISEIHLMYINNKCVYPELSDLFTNKDVTDKVNQLTGRVPNDIETLKMILDGEVEPNVLIGEQCDKPYPCPFKGYCWEAVPEKSIFTIPRLVWKKKNTLIEEGIFRISDLPANFPLTDRQQAYVNYVSDGQPETDKAAIKGKLSDLEYPIHFFDFETDNPAVPRFQGMMPHQHFPFQYSCHTWQSDGTVTHHEYLHTDTSDPRLPLVESLLDVISDVGSVVVYSSHEEGILESLAEFFPKYAVCLRSIQARLWDQLVIFRNHYKHPNFDGSNSLKSVLPVLVPSLHYSDLDVQDGREAQAVWNLMLGSMDEKEKDDMIRELKAYCKLDTLAMVEIHKVLLRLVSK